MVDWRWSAVTITGCPAGQAMLRASADVMLKSEILTLSHPQISQQIHFKVGVSVYLTGGYETPQDWSRSKKRWRPQSRVTYTDRATLLFLFFFFFFSGSRPGHTDGPIFARKRSNDAEWRKEVPFGVRKQICLNP